MTGKQLRLRVDATAVVMVDDADDWGPWLLFDVGGGQLLLLTGEEFDTENGEFPTSHFEIRVTRRRQFLLGIADAHGPIQIILHERSGDVERLCGRFRDGDILPGSLPVVDFGALCEQAPVCNVWEVDPTRPAP